MLKNISKLQSTHRLDKNQQKAINGGKAPVCQNGQEACFNSDQLRWFCIYPGQPCTC